MNAALPVKPTLALGNALMVGGLKSAMSAAYHLDDMGCTVREVLVFGRRPLVRIDTPPATCWLRGALRRRITERGVTRTVYVTVCHGAQVEWETSALRDPQEVRA
ncbi:hypothetical protein [Achromobacter sp.]|uniref:hypothetical protein n=1 Tax=Achromobacter sp. TaxID=134375 RepID=UPI003CFF601A